MSDPVRLRHRKRFHEIGARSSRAAFSQREDRSRRGCGPSYSAREAPGVGGDRRAVFTKWEIGRSISSNRSRRSKRFGRPFGRFSVFSTTGTFGTIGTTGTIIRVVRSDANMYLSAKQIIVMEGVRRVHNLNPAAIRTDKSLGAELGL